MRVVRLRLEPTRWGTRSLGMLTITFTDRYRLTEGKALIQLPCDPVPATASPARTAASC